MSYNKIIEELIEENEKLHEELFNKNKMSKDIKKWSYETEIKYLDNENKKLKEENKYLIESKNIWFDSHRLVTQERDKLKQELEEYRGF